jgi:pyruvate carboxylase
VGTKVTKGDKVLTLEAMKMQTTLYASADGIVDSIPVQVGETVETKDLLIKLRA